MDDKNDDATVFISDREVTIAGEVITVHEYTFRDTLKYHREIKFIVNMLTDLMMDKKEISSDEIKALIADNYDIVCNLVAGSVNKTPEWVEGIKGQSAIDLFDWWWVVNSPFFITAVKREEMMRDIRAARAAEAPAQD